MSLMNRFAFVKCTYCTYSVLVKILPCAVYTSPLSIQALQSRSCLSYATMAAWACSISPCYIALGQTAEKTPPPTAPVLLHEYLFPQYMLIKPLPSNGQYLSHHVTI
jgi:hypothetical protein